MLPETENTQLILAQADHSKRWLYALKELSGTFQLFNYSRQLDDSGNDAGLIYLGQIDKVVTVSGTFCLQLHSTYPINKFINSSSGMTVNNYVVNSQIGMLNTGEVNHVRSISINVGKLQERGQADIARTLNELLEAITVNDSWGHDEKTELLDQVEELSKQATLPSNQRAKPGTIKAIISGIGAAIGTAASLSDLWSTWGPTIRAFFQV